MELEARASPERELHVGTHQSDKHLERGAIVLARTEHLRTCFLRRARSERCSGEGGPVEAGIRKNLRLDAVTALATTDGTR